MFVLKYCDLVKVNVIGFVVDHKVFNFIIQVIYSSCVGICDVSTKICIINITCSIINSYDY